MFWSSFCWHVNSECGTISPWLSYQTRSVPSHLTVINSLKSFSSCVVVLLSLFLSAVGRLLVSSSGVLLGVRSVFLGWILIVAVVRRAARFFAFVFHSTWFLRCLLSKSSILMVRVSIVNCLFLTIRAWNSVFRGRILIIVVLIRFFPRFFLGIDFCGFWTKLRFSVTRWLDRVLQRRVRRFSFEMRKKNVG